MSRYIFYKKVRIQLAGKVIYATADSVEDTERKIIQHALSNGWRLTTRKSSKTKINIISTAKLLRKDGSPRCICASRTVNNGKLKIICMFKHGDIYHRSSITIKSPEVARDTFDIAVRRISKYLGLDNAQTLILHGSWDAFLERYPYIIESENFPTRQKRPATPSRSKEISGDVAIKNLLRIDGSPNYISITSDTAGRDTQRLSVSLSQGKSSKIRFTYSFRGMAELREKYEMAVARLVVQTGLDASQHAILLRAWDAFQRRNQAAVTR